MSVSHLTAQPVLVAGRFNRQRCAWCGELIVDEDLTTMMSTEPNWMGTEWPVSRIVRIDGSHTMVVDNHDGQMPEDSCMARTVDESKAKETNGCVAPPKLSLV